MTDYDGKKLDDENGWGWSKRVGFNSTTRSPCSCYMCGNPRKYNTSGFPHGETKQEYVSEIDFEEQLMELRNERKNSDNI